MVSHEPSPEDCPLISVEFEKVIYAGESDREYIPHVLYADPNSGEIEKLGPLDLEMSGDGNEVYLDGSSERAMELFRQLGGSAWAKIALDMKGYIPLAEDFHTPMRIYNFESGNKPEDLLQAA